MNHNKGNNANSRSLSSGMNTNNGMSNNVRRTTEMLDLSNDDSTGYRYPKMGKSVTNPFRQDSLSPQIPPNPYGNYGNFGNASLAAPFTPQDNGGLGPSSKIDVRAKLDYFGNDDDSDSDDSDAAPDTPTKPKRKRLSPVHAMNDPPLYNTANIGRASAGLKRRKNVNDPSRADSPGLFMTPGPPSPKVSFAVPIPAFTFPREQLLTSLQRREKLAGGQRKEFQNPRTNGSMPPPSFSSQTRNGSRENSAALPRKTSRIPCTIGSVPPQSFGAQARGIVKGNSVAPATQPHLQRRAQPQLAAPTGNDRVDNEASINYMKEQVQRLTENIVQPVIDLTEKVKKLELENNALHDKLNSFQKTVKTSISDIHERQEEQEALIDGLSTSIISPAGAEYGGPRNTAIKKKGQFHGMLSGGGEGAGGADAASS